VPSPSGTGVLSFTDEDTNTDEPHGHWRYDGPQNPNETSDDAGFSPMTDDRSQGDVENSRSGEDASSEHEDSGELETKSLEDGGLPPLPGRASRRARSAGNFGDNKSTGSSSGSGVVEPGEFHGIVSVLCSRLPCVLNRIVGGYGASQTLHVYVPRRGPDSGLQLGGR
jgi:hypothetical protein